jgi:signal transduction histidine kinase
LRKKKNQLEKISEEERSKLEIEKSLYAQRNKITADLHDEIGSTLSSLNLNSAVMLKMNNSNPDKSKNMLVKIESQSRELSEKINDIIWSIKPGADEFMSMINRIKNFVSDILETTDIVYMMDLDESVNKHIECMTARKNIILIIKEAVNNVVKYSKASRVDIRLWMEDDMVFIQVIDDGVGMDTSIAKGNGIGNMKMRTEEMNGKFSINSTINAGTEIFIQVPYP